MTNTIPFEPFYDEDDLRTFDLINNIDRDRSDLGDPFDIVAQLEHDIGCPLAMH